MYLEISPRRSGKTTRLLEAVTKHSYLYPDDMVYVIVYNAEIFHRIEYIMPRGVRILIDNQLLTSSIFVRGTKYRNMMFFFDEFTQLHHTFDNGKVGEWPYNDKYYYSSTPVYCDQMEKLLSMNNGHFRKYYDMESYEDMFVITYVNEDDEITKLLTL
jgi:hypothetical protein